MRILTLLQGNPPRMPTEWLDQALQASWQRWVESHPLVLWAIHHPVITLMLLLLVLLTVTSFLGAIRRMLEWGWMAVLTAPPRFLYRLAQVGLGWWRGQVQPPNPDLQSPAEQRITMILQRLDTLAGEQDALLKELRELLNGDQAATH